MTTFHPYSDHAFSDNHFASTSGGSVSPDTDEEGSGVGKAKIVKWSKEGPVKNACLSCRNKKAKCDGASPCSQVSEGQDPIQKKATDVGWRVEVKLTRVLSGLIVSKETVGMCICQVASWWSEEETRRWGFNSSCALGKMLMRGESGRSECAEGVSEEVGWFVGVA